MKNLHRAMLLSGLTFTLTSCDALFTLMDTAPPTVSIQFNWWNNLINVPVIEGTLTNDSNSTVCNTTIEVMTFDDFGNNLYTTEINLDLYISPDQSVCFKEWISGSPKACSLTATVKSWY